MPEKPLGMTCVNSKSKYNKTETWQKEQADLIFIGKDEYKNVTKKCWFRTNFTMRFRNSENVEGIQLDMRLFCEWMNLKLYFFFRFFKQCMTEHTTEKVDAKGKAKIKLLVFVFNAHVQEEGNIVLHGVLNQTQIKRKITHFFPKQQIAVLYLRKVRLLFPGTCMDFKASNN